MALDLAPIALFAYRRTDHLARTLDALEACPEFSRSPVTIYCDGPKPGSASDVVAVRAMLAKRKRSNMTIVEAASNRGLANSIIAGVTEQCARFGRVIVIEDDLLVSPATLTWFNAGLSKYAQAQDVWQVSAFQFDIPEYRNRSEGVFLNYCTSWGWATWKRAWDRFDPAAAGWEALKVDTGLRRRFDLNGAYPYAEMMEQQMAGRVDSWAIRWWWAIFQGSGKALFPPRSLVANCGEDSTATHAPSRLRRLVPYSRRRRLEKTVPALPCDVVVSPEAQLAIERAVRRQSQIPLWRAALKRIGL